MNYDLEAQEGKIYPHSRAIYIFFLGAFQVNYEVNTEGEVKAAYQAMSRIYQDF
jgi:hypothetical protein